MALVENETNDERTMTVLPWHRQGRQHSAPAQSDDLIPSCHGSLALCVRSGRRAFSASHRYTVFKEWALYEVFYSSYPFRHHIGPVFPGIIFLRSYLGFAKLQGVSCEQSSFRQQVLKAYSSRQSCLICPLRTSESRKIFPTHSRKALIKG